MGQPVTRAEAELAVERLLSKLEGWLLQQPEMLLIWTQDRDTRKRVEREVAKLLTTIPARGMVDANRAFRRRIIKALERQHRDWYEGIEQ